MAEACFSHRLWPGVPYIHIAISDPTLPDVAHNGDVNQLDILQLKFDDTEPKFDNAPPLVLMDGNHGHALIEFVRSHPPGIHIVTSCAAGVSRSRGVAVGLCEVYGWNDDFVYEREPGFCADPTPNVWCKGIVVRAARKL